MRSLLNQLADKNRQRETRTDLLTRGLITSAVGKQCAVTADQIRELATDGFFEREYRQVVEDLLEDPVFKEAMGDGHVTYAMIKPKANEALPANVGRSDDAVALEVQSSIRRPLVPAIVRPTYMPLSVASEFYDNLKGLGGNDAIFDRVAAFMSSAAMTGMVLLDETGDAIGGWRTQIGATDPKKAMEGTIRRSFSLGIENNVVHGSDSLASVQREINIFRRLI